jgi:hypothetical protein
MRSIRSCLNEIRGDHCAEDVPNADALASAGLFTALLGRRRTVSSALCPQSFQAFA